jgi:hypothetical protein
VDRPQKDIIFFPTKLLYNSGLNMSIFVVSIPALVCFLNFRKSGSSSLPPLPLLSLHTHNTHSISFIGISFYMEIKGLQKLENRSLI